MNTDQKLILQKKKGEPFVEVVEKKVDLNQEDDAQVSRIFFFFKYKNKKH